MFHTDRGSTCTVGFARLGKDELVIRQSAERVGSRLDNAAAESVLSWHTFATKALARTDELAGCHESSTSDDGSAAPRCWHSSSFEKISPDQPAAARPSPSRFGGIPMHHHIGLDVLAGSRVSVADVCGISNRSLGAPASRLVCGTRDVVFGDFVTREFRCDTSVAEDKDSIADPSQVAEFGACHDDAPACSRGLS